MASTMTVPIMKMYPKTSISNLLCDYYRRYKTTDGEGRSSEKSRCGNRLVADEIADDYCRECVFAEFAENRNDGFSFFFIEHGNIIAN